MTGFHTTLARIAKTKCRIRCTLSKRFVNTTKSLQKWSFSESGRLRRLKIYCLTRVVIQRDLKKMYPYSCSLWIRPPLIAPWRQLYSHATIKLASSCISELICLFTPTSRVILLFCVICTMYFFCFCFCFLLSTYLGRNAIKKF